MKAKVFLMFIVSLTSINMQAMATSVTTNLTVDDTFDLYISTNDSQLGTFVGSGSRDSGGWTTASHFTFSLTPGITNYLHVKGWDINFALAAFLGDFTISDSSFQFSNGTQSLVTDATNWKISNTGFGQSYYTPDAIMKNSDLWFGYYISGIKDDAYWIWSNHGADLATRYFSTTITPIPAPGAIILVGIGAGFVGWLRRRRAI